MTDGLTVLVVDDEESIRAMAALMLESGGYVAIALPPDAVAGWLQTHWPAALVLDVCMSPLDGIALLEAIHATYGRVPPTIFMTAYARPGHTEVITERAAQLGVVGVVTKPFDTLCTLADAVTAALQGGEVGE